MGISPEGVIAVAHEIGVQDTIEVLYKISDFVQHIRKLNKEQEDKNKDSQCQQPSQLNIPG